MSTVNLSYIIKNNEIFRFDSNYFQKEFINAEQLIRRKDHFSLVSKNVEIKSFGAYSLNNEVEYVDHGVPFIRGINMKKGRIQFNNMLFITEEANKLLWKSEVKPGMVLLSMSGTIGDVALASDNWEYPMNSNQDIAKIDTNGKINQYYLFAFLLSKYGQNYLIREARGSVQQHVFLSQIERFEIPQLKDSFINKLQKIIETSDLKNELSENSYAQAETLVLQSIGLQDFKLSDEAVNIKSFKDSLGATGRLDAEYYQPKYEELLNAIKLNESGFNRLDAFINSYSTGYPYKSESYTEDGIPLIRINNIQNGELDISNAIKIPFTDIDLSPKDVAKENDILISMSGTIGNSCKIPKGVEALINQRIMRITPKGYNFDVLPLVINSVIGKLQLERIGIGGVQTNISSNDIKNILIPTLKKDVEVNIAHLVKESFCLKRESEQMLETAKKAVEMAIEEGEDRAMEWVANKSNAI